MTFNSLQYLLFLPAVYVVFHYTADRWRWGVLLVASYLFYASLNAPLLLAVLFLVTAIGFICGRNLAASQDQRRKTLWFWSGVGMLVALLASVKYLPQWFHCADTTLPVTIGISYFTFQALSYLIDIHLEILEPEPSWGRYALYLAFFPKLLQGPIERGDDLLPQLNRPFRFDYDSFRSGVLLFAWGLMKKIVVADRLALFANAVFDDVHAYRGVALIVGTYAYALQIFFDFSGYTDMARGAARLFGIELTENFNSPYLATSVADFWRRWHISFSRWILDYIFKPLQMGWRDLGSAGTAAALVVTFLVSGVWHGATWGFIIWGALHGIYLAASTFYRPLQKKIHKALHLDKTRILKSWQVAVTFNLVSFAWIFFRARSLADCRYILANLLDFSRGTGSLRDFVSHNILLDQSSREFAVLTAVLSLLAAGSVAGLRKESVVAALVGQERTLYRWGAYFGLIVVLILFAVYSTSSFIYYRF